MKKTIVIFFISSMLLSCGGAQKASNAISSGNYYEAFELAISNLRKDKSSKNSQKNVPVLKEAYDKAAALDNKVIRTLEKSNSKKDLYTVYQTYQLMDVRQDEVKALQPLYSEGQEYVFNYEDYSQKTALAKNNLSKYLYQESIRLLATSKVENARIAHENLEELYYDINADYKNDVRDLLDKAKAKGSSFVLVTLKNKVNSQLKDSTSRSEISNFTKINTSNFNNPWVIYHEKREKNIQYNYITEFNLNTLQFVPEKLNQQKVDQKKRVQDGWKYTYDSAGNVMKDAEGNDMKEAKYVDVTAEVMLYQQVKSASLIGKLVIKNLKTGAVMSTHPLTGEAKLENIYAKYRGDQRAIEEKYYDALNKKEAQFPDDVVFKKYALDNLKKQGMEILNQQKF